MSDTPNRPLGQMSPYRIKAAAVEVIFAAPGATTRKCYRRASKRRADPMCCATRAGGRASWPTAMPVRREQARGSITLLPGPASVQLIRPWAAYSDSVPVLVLSSCLTERRHAKGQLHQNEKTSAPRQKKRLRTGRKWRWTAPAGISVIDGPCGIRLRSGAIQNTISVPIHLLEAEAAARAA